MVELEFRIFEPREVISSLVNIDNQLLDIVIVKALMKD